jgi:hypothetical protein
LSLPGSIPIFSIHKETAVADVEYTCPQCAKTIKVSEIVDPKSVICRPCRVPMTRAGAEEVKVKAKAGKEKLKFRPKEEPVITSPEVFALSEANGLKPEGQDTTYAKVEKKAMKKTFGSRSYILSWLLFAVMAFVAYYARYGGYFKPAQLKEFAPYAAFIVVALHITITLRAFKDSVFQGILCLIIPGYSAYYMLSSMEEYYLRAVVCSILIGVGQDGGKVIAEIASDRVDKINAWIQSGGGD